jgi:bla regulator protein BlaR1
MDAVVSALQPWATGFLAFAGPMLVQSTLVILLLLAVDRLIRYRVRPAVRYAVWMLALAKLLLSPALAVPTSVPYWLLAERPVVAPIPVVDIPDAVVAGDLPALVSEDVRGRDTRAAPAREATVSDRAAANVVVLFASWLAGVLVLAAVVVRASTRARRLVRASTEAPPGLVALVDECRRELGVRQRIGVRCTPFAHAPALYGLWRLQILVPTPVLRAFSEAELRAVLLHEVAHGRRRDAWVHAVQVLVQIAYWYHPLVWVANARIRRVREQAVDEVVRVQMRDRADAYPEVLLRVAQMTLAASTGPRMAYVGMLEAGPGLRERIERMMRMPVAPTGRLGVPSVALVLGAGDPQGDLPHHQRR